MSCRLCQICWTYWKRYGGLKVASRLADSGDIVDTTTATANTGTTPPVGGNAVSLKKQRTSGGPGTGGGSAGSDIDDDLTIVASSGPIGSLGTGGLSNHRPHR